MGYLKKGVWSDIRGEKTWMNSGHGIAKDEEKSGS
jgi:hypothetical protein